MKDLLQGYKTKVLVLATTLITLLQAFNITDLSEKQITSTLTFLAAGIALAIYDKINRL
jgi:hypothetical protein